MAGIVYSYAPDKVFILVNGLLLSGLGEDTALEIAPQADLSSSKVGIDGDVARSVGTDRRCDITIRLLQTSPHNQYLSGLVGVDLLTGGRLINITVKDALSTDTFVCPQAWVKRRPNMTYARETTDREWQFEGLPSVWNLGGSLAVF